MGYCLPPANWQGLKCMHNESGFIRKSIERKVMIRRFCSELKPQSQCLQSQFPKTFSPGQ